MPAYIAMLRGINVGGHKTIRMQDLRGLCEALGFRNIGTYVQSGNIVFLEEEKSASTLAKTIRAAIHREFGFDVCVFVKTVNEMKDLVENNPFLKDKEIDRAKLHVTFLSDASHKSAPKNLDKLSGRRDRLRIGRNEIYLYCPEGYGRTKLSNTALEKALSVGATTRNWKTVKTLLDMASKL